MHARKMRLVPYHEGEEHDLSTLSKVEPDYRVDKERDKYFRIVESKTVQTPGTPLSRLDREMYDILHTDALNDRDKWQIYRQILQKYLQKLPTPSGKKKIESKKSDDNKPPVSNDEILKTVPKKFHIKAKKLLDFAQNVGNIRWDDKGLVKVNGQQIKGNITDLINDAVRFRKNFVAEGRREFSAVMRQAGLPHEFVGNNSFWRDGSLINNTVNNAASTSYRDTSSRMETDTAPSSGADSSPPPFRNESRIVPVIRSSALSTSRRAASKKRPLEVSTVLNKTKVNKRRCIFQPMKRNYGGVWKRM